MRSCKCKYCGQQIESELEKTTIKVGKVNHNYHNDCYEQQLARDKALSLFYDYTGSLVMQNMVYLAFKKAREKGISDKEILYTMQYIVNTKSVLNYPMGILYYLDRAMKNKAEEEKREKANRQIEGKTIRIMPITQRKQEEKKDDYDISDLI